MMLEVVPGADANADAVDLEESTWTQKELDGPPVLVAARQPSSHLVWAISTQNCDAITYLISRGAAVDIRE